LCRRLVRFDFAWGVGERGGEERQHEVLLAEWLEVGTVWQNKQFETLGF
jgi:hypothetical protein